MRIGITFGVWDLFHYGHERFLKRAREHCDILMVGVVTDYWVRVQKGQDRPIDNIGVRMHNCKPYADKVFEFDTLDVSDFLKLCDIWIMGEDQKNMKPTYFKNFLRLDRTPNVSTTQLIEEGDSML